MNSEYPHSRDPPPATAPVRGHPTAAASGWRGHNHRGARARARDREKRRLTRFGHHLPLPARPLVASSKKKVQWKGRESPNPCPKAHGAGHRIGVGEMWESVALTLAGTAGNNIGKVLQKKGTLILPPLSLKLKVRPFPFSPSIARFQSLQVAPPIPFWVTAPLSARAGDTGVRVQPALDQRVPPGHVRRRANAHRALPGPGAATCSVHAIPVHFVMCSTGVD
jgi:hypothetical protein